MSLKEAMSNYLHGPYDPLHYHLMGLVATDTQNHMFNVMMQRIVDLEEKVKQLESSD